MPATYTIMWATLLGMVLLLADIVAATNTTAAPVATTAPVPTTAAATAPPVAVPTGVVTPPPGFNAPPTPAPSMPTPPPTVDPNATSSCITAANATSAPSLPALVDVFLRTFSEARLSSYLATIADAAGVEPARVKTIRRPGYSASEYGMEYMFPLEILDPLPTSPTSSQAITKCEASERLIAAITAAEEEWNERLLNPRLRATEPSKLSKATIYSARAIVLEKRQTEEASVGVDYLWVAFILVAMAMIFFSVLLFIRQRGVEEGGQVFDKEVKVPEEAAGENLVSMQELLVDANTVREQEAEERGEPSSVFGGLSNDTVDRSAIARRVASRRTVTENPDDSIFASSLQYTKQFSLPARRDRPFVSDGNVAVPVASVLRDHKKKKEAAAIAAAEDAKLQEAKKKAAAELKAAGGSTSPSSDTGSTDSDKRLAISLSDESPSPSPRGDRSGGSPGLLGPSLSPPAPAATAHPAAGGSRSAPRTPPPPQQQQGGASRLEQQLSDLALPPMPPPPASSAPMTDFSQADL